MRVGIDLGPTDACIARVDTESRPSLIADHGAADVFHTPSAVHVFTNGALVGRMAERLREFEPEAPVVDRVALRLGDDAAVQVDETGAEWFAESLVALMLKKLRFDAEAQGSSTIDGAVIAVPAGCDELRQRAAMAAAALADLPMLGLVEEPVAVALHYGRGTSAHPESLLVCDLGGLGIDVAVLRVDSSGCKVLAHAQSRERGGRYLDDQIGARVLAQFEKALSGAVPKGARTLLELHRVAEELKRELWASARTSVRRLVLLGSQAVEVELDRADMSAALTALGDDCEALVVRCLKDAHVERSSLGAVLLAGGGALLPPLVDRVRETFSGVSVLLREPDRAVACGAAIHALQLGSAATPVALAPELKGMTGSAIGLRTLDPGTGRVSVDTLVKRHMPLPAKAQKRYYTTRPKQERVVLDCMQLADGGEAVVSLGQVVVGPLSAERPNYAIEVTLTYKEDGTVKIEAYDAQTGVEFEQVFGRESDQGLRRLASQRVRVRSTVINGVIA